MIDVVYPLSNHSKFHDDWELRYSLRSLQMQNWVKNVYVVGHKPEWIKDIIHAPCGDPYVTCKDANIINKILLVCCQEKLTDAFLVNSDDQYFLKLVHEFPAYIENPCRISEIRLRSASNNWHKRVLDTIYWCRDNGFPDYIFQAHIPYLVDKKEYPVVMSKIAWGYGNGVTTHFYLNVGIDYVPQKESKDLVYRAKTSVVDKDAMKQATYLNHNDAGLTHTVKHFLEDLFPVPSRWEK